MNGHWTASLVLVACPAFIACMAGAEESPPVTVTFLDPQWQKGLGRGRSFPGSDGKLWRNEETKLLRWDEKALAWQATPVASKPRSSWVARNESPWHLWLRPLRVIPGLDGSLLAIHVRDVYQDLPPKTFASERPLDIEEAGKRLAKQRGGVFWLEAWLYRDGAWSEPRPLVDLLKSEHRFFAGKFVIPTPEPAFFDLQVAGEVLWWSDGNTVHALEKDGQEATWTYYPGTALTNANLVLLGNGTLWCFVAHGVTALKLTSGKIEATPEPLATWPKSYNYKAQQHHVARNGELWGFQENAQGFAGTSFVFRKEGWTTPEGLGLFVLEDADGVMWFMPGGKEEHAWYGYNIFKDNNRLRLVQPDHIPMFKLAQAGRNLLLASCGDRVIVIARSKEEPGWAIQNSFGLKQYEVDPIWLDGAGNLVSQRGWYAKWPETKPGK